MTDNLQIQAAGIILLPFLMPWRRADHFCLVTGGSASAICWKSMHSPEDSCSIMERNQNKEAEYVPYD
ncbi:hypothetical protein [Anaerolactibacter massiliensis]|uniref:hypothetical protein n=1 Tax=Anaerolactibacter massiliensis TaxID=2044573 RepID=UPI000CFA7CF1|nr:hypothetical protein [Anaerolactibacter massiliensis]